MIIDHLSIMLADAQRKREAWAMHQESIRQRIENSGWERKPLENIGKVALVCIANNEDRYIQEWIDYHFKLGIDEIFIYEHDWRSGLVMDRVHIIPFDGPNRHTYSYNEFLFTRSKGFDWVIFLDVDEFLVLKRHASIQEFLYNYGNLPASVDGIAVNWTMFGDNGHDTLTDGSVLERFTRRGTYPDRHIQMMVRMNGDRMMASPHHSFGFWIDTNGKVGQGQDNFNGTCDVIQVNHYFCKSRQEYTEKKLGQGRADCEMERTLKEYDFYNQNDVEDLTALNFYRKGHVEL